MSIQTSSMSNHEFALHRDTMIPYIQLLDAVMMRGTRKEDRTGVGTTSVFGEQMKFNLTHGFPLLTHKKVPFRLIVAELLWFISGDTNVKRLHEEKCHIWDEWADEEGDLGPIYGKQWRSWPQYGGGEIDQLHQVIEMLKTDPDSRRHIVSAWNPAQLNDMALAPCHVMFQFYSQPLNSFERYKLADVDYHEDTKHISHDSDENYDKALDAIGFPKRRLSCQLYQRSADLFLGVPFNIASYALLTHMVAHLTNHVPGQFIWTGGDCHIYDNHRRQVSRMISRKPFVPPTLKIVGNPQSIDDFKKENIALEDYQCHPTISAPVAV